MKIKILSGILLLILLSCTSKVMEPTSSTATNKTKPVNHEEKYYVLKDGAYVEQELDKKPLSNLGKEQFKITMYRSIKYPPGARENGTQGTVFINVIINEFGQASDYTVSKGIGSGCDEEALNAVKRGCQSGFEPAVLDGKSVKVKYVVPVFFRLN